MNDYGVERLLRELVGIGHPAEKVTAPGGNIFVVILRYEVPAGQFIGRIIDLGLQATPDFPNSVAAAIHVRAAPQLYECCNISNVRNVQASELGPEWRYWSKNFNWHLEQHKTARRYMAKVTTIFENA
jgi:hypothetical protein